MKKFEIALKWDDPKLCMIFELEGLNTVAVLDKIKKDTPLPFEDISMLSIETIE